MKRAKNMEFRLDSEPYLLFKVRPLRGRLACLGLFKVRPLRGQLSAEPLSARLSGALPDMAKGLLLPHRGGFANLRCALRPGAAGRVSRSLRRRIGEVGSRLGLSLRFTCLCRVQRAGVAFLARSLLFQKVVACVSAGAVSCSRNPGQRGFAVMRRVPLAGAKKKP